MSDPIKSKAEAVRDVIIAECEAITEANEYRQTIKKVGNAVLFVDDVRTFPSIAVMLGTEQLAVGDDAGSLFDSLVDVHIYGYVKAPTSEDGSKLTDALEAMRHDLKRLVGRFYEEHVVPNTDDKDAWTIQREQNPIVDVVFQMDKANGYVYVTFKIVIYNQDTTFNAAT